MKMKIRPILLTLKLFFLHSLLHAQISKGGMPYTSSGGAPTKSTHVVVAPFPESPPPLLAADPLDNWQQRDSYEGPYQVAYEIAVDYDLKNSGTWETLPNGDRIWQLTIVSRHARHIYLYYRAFHIPAGGRLHLYNENKKQILGAFTERNNRGSKESPGRYATSYVDGDRITLEYYEPKEKKGAGTLAIERVFHAYEDMRTKTIEAQALGDSLDCNINASCQMGAKWEKNRRSVVRLLTKRGFCSGTLVNNAKKDGKIYVLTAFHCVSSINNDKELLSAEDLERTIVYWEFEYDDCRGERMKPEKSTVGGRVLSAQYKDDYALLELTESPLMMESIPFLYYSGWNRKRKEEDVFVSFHPPKADAKKVSIFENVTFSRKLNDEVTSPIVGTTLSRAELITVKYEDGTDGITEQGSSGGGLFNQHLELTGVLSTGKKEQNCHTDGFSNFSPLFVFWERGRNGKRIKDVLDPLDTHITRLDGMDLCEMNSGHLSSEIRSKIRGICKPHVLHISTAAYTQNSLHLVMKVDEAAKRVHWKMAKKDMPGPFTFDWLMQEGPEGTVRGVLENENGENILRENARTNLAISFPKGSFALSATESCVLYYAFEHAETGRHSQMYVADKIDLADLDRITEPTIIVSHERSGAVEIRVENTQGERVRWAIVSASNPMLEVNTETISRDSKILKKGSRAMEAECSDSWMIEGLEFSQEYILYMHVSYPKDISEIFTRKITTQPPKMGVLIMPGQNRVGLYLKSNASGVITYKIVEAHTGKIQHMEEKVMLEKDKVYSRTIRNLKNAERYQLIISSFQDENERGTPESDIVAMSFNTGAMTGDFGLLQEGYYGRDKAQRMVFLHPNPVRGSWLYIDTPLTIAAVEIMDAQGREMMRERGNLKKLDLSSLVRGTYLVSITLKNKEKVMQKIIKE